ncbi:1,4-dihydroxy-2-naphthoate octaprenyltransferase [Propionibacterium cyclohexanicum]|uniref:1,4-dihydroxy-2-naphthoate octaprenyltransferase n=1 Tax=Propionibacterium cyclohexanicum TaxID=64702 RepID=A0A1H9TKS8_9ACTN|nr:1,4-dihydroxy-2-naphthoate polyprenyltransferase [Propionibacterium cyclohexanicum]SER97223.1 1,4-dihydroxy-2-naphthoate octaprenyltransferase [Propionibacterium cyclohexanicum]
MATAAEWLEGARPRTLPTGISPVLAGTAIAWWYGQFDPGVAVLCLVVALALVVGVNFANDYSDGVRGADDNRVGPQRLVGSGAADPRTVRNAALGCFGMAGLAGLAAVSITGYWWLLVVGVACVLAAWFYTGGRHPYGYLGLGEIFVFVFFGLVAVGGTVYLQLGRVPAAGWASACGIGLLACAVLVTNNLRDIASDTAAGKRTLETRLGDRATRWLYVAIVLLCVVCALAVAALTTWWALLALVALVLLAPACRSLLAGATGMDLVATLKATGQGELLWAVGLFIGIGIGLLT